MTAAELKRRLRERSEYALRLAAQEDVARRYPNRTARSALPSAGVFWRYLFVPLFRRVPWSYKRQAMRRLKMTAPGWREDARQFSEPWRPPPRDGHASSTDVITRAGEAQRPEG